MSYRLILRETDTDDTKAVGENLFLANLPEQFPVYAFYYPAELSDQSLENALRGLGGRTGDNLLVNLGRLDDPNFDKIARAFDLDSFPALAMTAVADLAAPPGDFVNAYVRLDGRLLKDPGRAIELVENLYLLFLRGDVAKAIRKVRWRNRTELLRTVAASIGDALGGIGGFVAERDIAVSLLEGRFELTKSA
jgi:hypothetical protein